MIDSRLRFVRTSMLTRLLLVLSVAVLIASAPACDNTTSSAPTPTPLQITEKPAPAPPPPIAPVAQQPIFVVFESMSGKIRIQLHTKEAPRICANFLNLIQRGRERAENVVDCVECSASALHIALTQVEALAPVPSAQFGNGQTGVRIAELLASADPNRYSLAKHNTF